MVTYGNGDESLLKFTCLLEELIAYALAPTQERDLESVHGKTGALEKKALGARRLPSSVCPIVRQPYWSPLLRNDAFHAFLHEHWQSDYYADLMLPWSSRARTQSLDVRLRVAEIYQYDFSRQFHKEAETRSALDTWKASLPSLHQANMAELIAAETVFCQYWRCVLEVGAIYSFEQLPTNEGSTGPATFMEALASFTHTQSG